MNKTYYKIEDYDRMFTYLWSENGNDNECKFGERFVESGQNPYIECNKRIRESLGVRKDKFDHNEITIHEIFDVSEYAKKYKKFYKNSKVDDHIRKEIGFRKQGEIHNLSADDFIEKFTKYMTKDKSSLSIKYVLRFYQYYIKLLFLYKLKKTSKKVIDFVLELAARFGKTIWSLDLFKTLFNEYNYKIAFLPSYVLTSHSSFKDEFYRYEDFFKDMIYVENIDDLKDIVNEYYGKKMIIVETSLHTNDYEKKLEFIKNLPSNEKISLIDEADFGAHRTNSQDFIRFIGSKLNIYMTGTGIEKVVSPLENLEDNVIRWSYTDMLLVKKGEHPIQKHLTQN